MIPIARPDIGQEEITAVTEVLQSGMIAQGRKVKELEDRWAEYVGVEHAIAVGNGTLALMAIFAGIGLDGPTPLIRFRESTVAGRFAGITAVDGVSQHVILRSGRMPRTCMPAR